MKIIKNAIKVILVLILVIITLLVITVFIDINEKKVYAASNSSTSDIQLMARAINGEARGEPYEGQVAVRCSYIKSSKRP